MEQNFSYLPLGLYIHWPFCLKKCPYCDFNSYAFEHEPEIWVNALLEEIRQGSKQFPYYKLRTIFFGGGTPSLIPPKYIKQLIDQALYLWSPWNENKYIEITLETNPSTIESHALDEFMKAGINRFSIGMQSLKDENLQFLGRLHSAKEAVEIATHAAKICDNVSTDFIYALPKDTIETWKKDLDDILTLADKIGLEHISLYQLTIENNTSFETQVEAKLWTPMNDDKQSELYMHTYATLYNANWDFYEISNAARVIDQTQALHEYNVPRETLRNEKYYGEYANVPRETLRNEKYCGEYANVPRETLKNEKYYGEHDDVLCKTFKSVMKHENPTRKIASYTMQSQHNLIYWRYQQYLGIGAGAHSRMIYNGQRIKFNNTKNPYKWIEQVKASRNGFLENKIDFEILDAENEFQEKALMGLRLKEGIKITSEEMQFVNKEKLEMLIDSGFLKNSSNKYATTLSGRMCLNAVLKTFLK